MDVGVTSHIGYFRERNEDATLSCAQIGLWAVADGVGGGPCGEVASATAIKALEQEMRRDLNSQAAFLHADRQVAARGEKLKCCVGMLTTLCAVHLNRNSASIVWIGDSSCYLLSSASSSKLQRLTQSHLIPRPASLEDLGAAQSAVEATGYDRLAYASERRWPRRPQFLGSGNLIKGDLGIISQPLERFDLLILCTDGLTNDVPEAEIEMICVGAVKRSAQEIASALVNAALSHGGHDNISVIVLINA